MTTSAEQIAALIQAVTDLKIYIDDTYQADLARYQNLQNDVADLIDQTFFVDQVNGSDAAVGTRSAEPLKTLQEASDRAISGGILRIHLMTDYHMTEVETMRADFTLISGYEGVQKRMTFAGQAVSSPRHMPHITTSFNVSSLRFSDIIFELGTASPAVVEITAAIGTRVMTAVNTAKCEWIVPAGSDQAFIDNTGGFGLISRNAIVPPEMAGRWVSGVAAATDPATLHKCSFTNLRAF